MLELLLMSVCWWCSDHERSPVVLECRYCKLTGCQPVLWPRSCFNILRLRFPAEVITCFRTGCLCTITLRPLIAANTTSSSGRDASLWQCQLHPF